MGNFKDFVHEVAKSASMIKYLNAKQNKKQSPNENFARELMELFTLGVGNYTEKDESLKRPLAKFYQDISEDIKSLKLK